ncbi:hypothetical protein GCM10023093_00960 [Nemorincola caseinilytica]|uniref:Uncharacterized protein n=1 Tax=Nemorincola caseinilytica TaxID=2054315 RepID=A0ABP8N400_9BACT
MNKLDTSHPDYIKGFQEGYMITMHLPEISDWMARKKDSGLKYAGFLHGRLEYLMEKVQDLVIKQDAWEWDDDE